MTKQPYKRFTFFASETIPSFAGGGRNAFQFARYLTHEGISTTICCLNYNNKLPVKEHVDGVVIYRIKYYNKSVIHKIISIPYLVFNYNRQILDTEVLYLYGAYLPLTWLIILLGKARGKKIIFRSTLLDEDDFISLKKRSTFWPVTRAIYNQISLYHSLNKQFKECFQQVMTKDIRICNHSQGVNFNNFKKNNTLNKDEKPYVILSVGFLIKRKGYQMAFDALKDLKFPFKYIIVGQFKPDLYHRSSRIEFDEMNEIYAKGKSVLADKIEFAGTTENLFNYFKKTDLFLHSSYSEGVPNVVLEAMAYGLPVLLNGNSYYVNDYFNQKQADKFYSSKELTERINYHYHNREFSLKMGIEGKKNIENYHTFEQLYQELIKHL